MSSKLICTNPIHLNQPVGNKMGQIPATKCLRQGRVCPYLAYNFTLKRRDRDD